MNYIRTQKLLAKSVMKSSAQKISYESMMHVFISTIRRISVRGAKRVLMPHISYRGTDINVKLHTLTEEKY